MKQEKDLCKESANTEILGGEGAQLALDPSLTPGMTLSDKPLIEFGQIGDTPYSDGFIGVGIAFLGAAFNYETKRLRERERRASEIQGAPVSVLDVDIARNVEERGGGQKERAAATDIGEGLEDIVG